MDPTVDYIGYDLGIMNNIYEYLLWYNGSSGSQIIPWLAQNYTIAADHKTVDFNLRTNITFQDGEQFNSTAAYFSILRGFIIDGASPTSLGGYGPAWIVQQLANTSLSNVLSGQPQAYTESWVNQVLAENFVQITGPSTFVMNLQHYDGAFPYLFATWGDPIVAPEYTMQHDLATWTAAGYKLPYPALSGNETTQITQYFDDEVATCGVSPTAGGCATTYFDESAQGSMGGTGPYTLQSWSQTTQDIVLQANPNYWGGPYQFMGGQKVIPQIKTININFVPSPSTRLLDLQNAARTGAALIISETNDHLYDVADRNAWLNNGTLQSIIPGVSIYGPQTSLNTQTVGLNTNVSNPLTGKYYAFQPFADLRVRLAFADSINMSEINIAENNGMGQVEINLIPPGIGPPGAYNTSIVPKYSFNLTASQDLLLAAMEQPITSFTNYDGQAAASGEFNNTFGCTTLNSHGACTSPVQQTIPLSYATGDTLGGTIVTEIAEAINNISSTYNMGLTVTVVPQPEGTLVTQAFAGQTYSFDGLDWTADYPWVTDYTGTLLAPGGTWFGIQHYNYSILGTLSNEALTYSHAGDLSDLVKTTSEAFQFANNEVEQIQTVYPLSFEVLTSNIQGFFYNPVEPMYDGAGQYTFYFATMY
jgi:ABC-type transport system substrate-binding protein